MIINESFWKGISSCWIDTLNSEQINQINTVINEIKEHKVEVVGIIDAKEFIFSDDNDDW